MRTLHMLHSLDAEVGKPASTVRLGTKWADLAYGEKIELCVCTRDPDTHDVQGEGTVVSTWWGIFNNVPARFLVYEHEERSRRYDGLLASMQNAYGDAFDDNGIVTVVVYRRES